MLRQPDRFQKPVDPSVQVGTPETEKRADEAEHFCRVEIRVETDFLAQIADPSAVAAVGRVGAKN